MIFANANPILYIDLYGLWSIGDPLPQSMVDAATGFGDSVSLNITSLIRDAADLGGVNKCSTAYQAGSWGAFALGGGRLAYAGFAKGYSIAAHSGAAASTFRSRIRVLFGGGGRLRPPNMAKYPTDDALRAAAGRTNPYANAYGAGVATAGAYNGSGCDCPQ